MFGWLKALTRFQDAMEKDARDQLLKARSLDLDAREKRIAEREEILSVRLFEPGQSIPTRVVSKHPALAAPYAEIPRRPYTTTPDNFAALRAANIARNPEWFPDGTPPVLPASFRGLELAGEVGEGVEAALTHLAMLTASAGRICNILKKLERERLGLNGSRSTKEALAEELGDFIICADLVGMDFDIATWPAVVAKFNATSNKLGMKTLLPTPEQMGDWSQSTWQEPEIEEEGRTCDVCGGDGNSRQPGTDGICPECNGEGKLL